MLNTEVEALHQRNPKSHLLPMKTQTFPPTGCEGEGMRLAIIVAFIPLEAPTDIECNVFPQNRIMSITMKRHC